MSADARKLLEALEEIYGNQVQLYEGVVYLKGWRLDMDKLEADFHKWQVSQ